MFMSFSKSKFTFLYQNSVTDVSVCFRPPCLGLSRFCSEKAKKLLRNMPKSCSKVAEN